MPFPTHRNLPGLECGKSYGRFLFLKTFKSSIWLLQVEYSFKRLENFLALSHTTHLYDALVRHFCRPGVMLTLTPDFLLVANAQLSECDFLLFVAYSVARDDFP